MDETVREQLWRAVQCTVEKDVVCTERSLAYLNSTPLPLEKTEEVINPMSYLVREEMDDAVREQFWRAVQCTVEKDVVRTDRSHAYFKGADNPNIEILKLV